MVIWLIGLSGSGKSTIGSELSTLIRSAGNPCVFLDGDIVREILGNDLSHTLDDRRRNAERICRLCAHLETQRVNVVCGILSIFPESRDWNRKNHNSYFEVFVDASIEELKKRDTKGIYKNKKNVVGVDISFPIPTSPDHTVKQDFSFDALTHAKEIFKKLKDNLV